jgi:hypothetical protein
MKNIIISENEETIINRFGLNGSELDSSDLQGKW